ncbi:MAG: hypothetical protein ABW173_04820 [Sphingomonas sp.]
MPEPHMPRLSDPDPSRLDHAGLDGLEAAVLARIGAMPPARAGGGMIGALAIAAALAIGVGGGILGGGVSPALAAPLGMDGALAPSTLLLGR